METWYSPGSLPEITSAAVVLLRHVEPGRVGYMKAAGDAPAFAVEGDEAQRLADLWRRLPPGEMSRCHVPAYGLRFFAGGRLVCEASVCWRCDNMAGESEGEPFGHAFDASAGVSRELLAEVQRISGEQADG
jgi:hypothetical protein